MPAAQHRESLVGWQMVGDPRFDDSGRNGLMIRRACQYAAGILKKRRELPDDASAYRATWEPSHRSVLFWKGGKLEIVFRVPDRVMDFKPWGEAQVAPD